MARREVKRVNGELFTMTYGALVAQLLEDYESDDEVNKQLDKMGYNIGVRMVDDFIANTNTERCGSFKETCTTLAKEGFRMFLGVTATISNWTADDKECTLTIDDNPLVAFVELPDEHRELNYCNMYCGAIRGALELLQYRTRVTMTKDVLKGDKDTQLTITLLEVLDDVPPPED
ncbi:trafficking protein particle complex subunit 3 [Salpingoeca rosetta]|uniref:Trafficking protein particle complex subunit n=1 Tax=Salpingoeca rosetta (strain ATCC 50818 / BSB-021) TaxID=946362 RepID=F2UT79_SALR5|nr:trafficking protein particle complex subunit 3 [Salpingoeca rosetta]EGD81338.1 trafficking protein particle complex subunit 3 [Salpingoeca rosetta]|eukprot:XP_004987625.1 trafficking protein particle complex subunit 3 [Salpingoeca rosetta]